MGNRARAHVCPNFATPKFFEIGLFREAGPKPRNGYNYFRAMQPEWKSCERGINNKAAVRAHKLRSGKAGANYPVGQLQTFRDFVPAVLHLFEKKA